MTKPSVHNRVRSSFIPWRSALLILAASHAALLSGCSPEYNRRMGETLEEFNRRAELTKDLHAEATELTNSAGEKTGITIQLPSLFGANATVMNDNSQGVEPERLYPPGGKPMGYSFAYEQITGAEGAQVPVYCYFSVINANRFAAAEVQTTLQPQLSISGWQPLQLDTPDGGQLECRYASISGQQPFAGATLDGRLDAYLVSGPLDHVVVIWRAPSSQKEFFNMARSSVATISGLSGGGDAAAESSESSEPADEEGEQASADE